MKLRNSFEARIASVLILLLLVVFGALYVAVKGATVAAVHGQASEELGVGVRVFERLLELRGRQLHDAVQVLAADFGFKDAVASGDKPTIRSALANSGARIKAETVMLLGLDGRLQVATTEHANAERLAELLQRRRHSGAQSLLLPMDEAIYLLVEAPVRTPLPVARVVMGFRLNDAFAKEMRALTHLEMSLVAAQKGQADIWLSTLPDAAARQLQGGFHKLPAAEEQRLTVAGQHYLGRQLLLASGPDYQVRVLLHKSLDQAQAAFKSLDKDILFIAVCALLGSLAGALLLARSVSQPVRQLATAAARIGEGDYQTALELHRGDELGSLAKAFNLMRGDIAERERQLAHNALHDPLTGLPNRTLALERLGSSITAARPMALLYVGVDNFRTVNETLGPGGGDQALQQIGRRLQATLRPGDSLARLVAAEFLILLESCNNEGAVAVADQLQQLLLKPLRIGSQEVPIDCRFGIAGYPADGDTAENLLRRAGIAMRDAGQLPGRLQIYQQGREADQQRQITLIRDLLHAPRRGELLLHYQPKLDLRSGRVQRVEALLRWRHAQLGMVAPGEFIPLAERTGSIQLLTAWVIEETLRQLRDWAARGLFLQVSLNISSDDLRSHDLADRVRDLLVQYAIPADQLLFEVTESAVMQSPEQALKVLGSLRSLGICLSVDDFGTGYSSLAQLKRMPVQELKIDQSFVRNLDATSEDAVIVRSTIEMSHSLGLKVVAEGVELERSLRLLERWQCDTVQGELISRPLAPEALEAWLAQPLVLHEDKVLSR
ncbi:EAL domain-containing protein [Pseudomonas cavernae]|uniref:EAL domain-containing protein n=1 Tax=Pseudomonas cavernae TaxID=2320867 RepID=A0A385Z562_9PSED|nr:EAL domain-containing protein [Pseudomonas cavernae]AYC33904.1 EAL domain-containing protein [Pseudomonas cavernae]